MKMNMRRLLAFTMGAGLASFAIQQGTAAALSTIYSFSTFGPPSSLTIDNSGVLYGTAESRVFSVQPPTTSGEPWTGTIIYDFATSSEGFPYVSPGLILGPGGEIYGATRTGGTAGLGSVFVLVPPVAPSLAWTATMIYNFTSIGDGALPNGGLIMGPTGELYGTTDANNTHCRDFGCGVVFELLPPTTPGGSWTEVTLHVFHGYQHQDGQYPSTPLLLGANGRLYGTTSAGGNASSHARGNRGTIFELRPPASPGGKWKETLLHTFTSHSRYGQAPNSALTLGPDGNFFGTTSRGGRLGEGVVYQLSRPSAPSGQWSYSVLSDLPEKFGGYPSSGGPLLVDADGTLYGVLGASLPGDGLVYQLQPPLKAGVIWREKVLAILGGHESTTKGFQPIWGLVSQGDSIFYGVTEYGPGLEGHGTVFQVTK